MIEQDRTDQQQRKPDEQRKRRHLRDAQQIQQKRQYYSGRMAAQQWHDQSIEQIPWHFLFGIGAGLCGRLLQLGGGTTGRSSFAHRCLFLRVVVDDVINVSYVRKRRRTSGLVAHPPKRVCFDHATSI